MSTSISKDESAGDNVGIISMQDFLKFLKLSVNVNDTLDKHSRSANFNFDQLSKNELVNNLMRKYKSIADISTNTSVFKIGENSKEDEAGKKRKRSAKMCKNISLKSKVGESCDNSNMFPNLNPLLTVKLDEVLSQGTIFIFFLLKCY